MVFFPPGKLYVFLHNFEKTFLENLICSYVNFSSWKFVCVLGDFRESSPDCNFANICLWDMISWKIVSVLTKLWENSWKIWSVLMVFLSPRKSCVLTKFWTASPGKFDLFLRYFFHLENCMCSCGILRKLSWKFWCVLVHFASPGKFLYYFWFFWKIWCVLMKEIYLLLENSCFLLHSSLLEILICSRNLFKNVGPGKKNIF